MRRLRRCVGWVLGAVAGMMPAIAGGQTLTLNWDPNPLTDLVTSYSVCVGTASYSCNTRLASVLALQTSFTLTGPAPGVLYFFSVKARSLLGTSKSSLEVAASIPSLTQPATQFSTLNTPIVPLNLAVSDPDGDPLQFSHIGLPFGLSMNATTGRITGTPTSTGTFTVTVLVSDRITTTSRSFLWTVGTADVIPPTIAIASPASGQTISATSVTVSGTASDSGAGGNGISRVTVNGTLAGGTAIGNGIVNWSRTVSLTAGANTISIQATDGAGNVRTAQLGVTSSPPLAVSAFAPSVASPRVLGASVNWSAATTGGIQPVQYKFLVKLGTGTAQVVRNWSTTSAFTWIPTSTGSYTVMVWTRNAGVTVDAPQASAQAPYSIVAATTSTGPLAVALTASHPSPQVKGTAVTFTANATGGTSPHQFKWWASADGGATWVMARDWSTTNTYTWSPTIAATHRLAVWVRNAGTTADIREADTNVWFTIADGSLMVTSLTASRLSPQAPGTTITFTATAIGGTAPYQYKWFYSADGGITWVVARNWSTANWLSWKPLVPAGYRLAVWVRNAGTTADIREADASMWFAIQ